VEADEVPHVVEAAGDLVEKFRREVWPPTLGHGGGWYGEIEMEKIDLGLLRICQIDNSHDS
jgi:hypothetical protein